MRSTTDNTGEYEHNWIDRLVEQVRPHAEAVMEAAEVIPQEDGSVHFKVDQSVSTLARIQNADFDLEYVPSGYAHPETGELVIPRYEKGAYKGDPADQYLLRTDTNEVVGNMSGRYPDRDGYKHVFATLDELFPQTCESVSVYGNGERVVVEQVLDEPFDLGNGDTIQPYIYTRMSLNGTWKTEIIPISRRISCENMLGYGNYIIGVRATKNHDSILTMRSQVVEMSMAQGNTLKRMAQTLLDQTFTDQEFANMVDNLLPYPDVDAHVKTQNAAIAKRGAVLNAWSNEGSENMWAAFNAFQGGEQHRINANYKTTKKAQERSFLKALDGKTPIADAAELYLMSLVSVSEEPF